MFLHWDTFYIFIADKLIYESSEAYTHPYSGVVHSAEFVVDGIARNAVRDNNFCSQEVWCDLFLSIFAKFGGSALKIWGTEGLIAPSGPDW